MLKLGQKYKWGNCYTLVAKQVTMNSISETLITTISLPNKKTNIIIIAAFNLLL